MSRRHAAAVSVIVGVAALAGVGAAAKTAGLGSEPAATSPAALTQRAERLDEVEASLERLRREAAFPLQPAPAGAGESPPEPIHVSAASGDDEHEDEYSEHEGDDD